MESVTGRFAYLSRESGSKAHFPGASWEFDAGRFIQIALEAGMIAGAMGAKRSVDRTLRPKR